MESKRIKIKQKVYCLYPVNYIPSCGDDGFNFDHAIYEIKKCIFVEHDEIIFNRSKVIPYGKDTSVTIPTDFIFVRKSDANNKLLKTNRDNIQNILMRIKTMSDDISELKGKFNKLKSL